MFDASCLECAKARRGQVGTLLMAIGAERGRRALSGAPECTVKLSPRVVGRPGRVICAGDSDEPGIAQRIRVRIDGFVEEPQPVTAELVQPQFERCFAVRCRAQNPIGDIERRTGFEDTQHFSEQRAFVLHVADHIFGYREGEGRVGKGQRAFRFNYLEADSRIGASRSNGCVRAFNGRGLDIDADHLFGLEFVGQKYRRTPDAAAEIQTSQVPNFQAS